ncbi:YesL family protein [Alkalihalobacillus trypoxylicola]|uniref:DUF624 domain-containing protein n=1 Tax=Alkalihalobacillus trypoxylicola TaxID=519424 RepID=A0A161PJ78_9BACI|nr:DUF624 domain-containing protein [Alkalihalobacillus trypoxylicola]KYG33862.1 hypothetical protein AZF04_15205 [Alkalihalobacillus trypoxylicola]
MQETALMDRLLLVCQWIYKLFLLNLFWLGYTLLGLGFFGIFPASVALLTFFRDEFLGKNTEWKGRFFRIFKKELVKSNLYGWSFVFAAYLGFNAVSEIQQLNSILWLVFLVGTCILLVVSVYVPALYVHYHLSPLAYMKAAFILTFSFPVITGAKIVSLLFLYYLFSVFPAFLPFFLASLPSWVLIVFSMSAIKKLESEFKI